MWTKDWKIKLNKNKSSKVKFTLRLHGSTPMFIEGHPINIDGSAKYLRVHMDQKLTWKTHLQKKRDELNIRFRSMFRFFNTSNKLTLTNKRLLYIATLRPVWTYAIQLWGCTPDTNYLFDNTMISKQGSAEDDRGAEVHHQ